MRSINFDPPDWRASLNSGFVRAVNCDSLEASEAAQGLPKALADHLQAAAFAANRNGNEAFVLVHVTPAYGERLRKFQARAREALAK